MKVSNNGPAKLCKMAGFSGGLAEVSKLAGESRRTLEKWPLIYPRRFELILKGLMFERAAVKAEQIEL